MSELRLPAVAAPYFKPGTRQSTALAYAWMVAPFALAGLFGLIAALIYVMSPGVTRPAYDDAYISLTFARNLAEHGKLSFDGQIWSTGATSPLHVFILSIPLFLGVGPIATSIGVGVASHVFLCIAVYALAWSIFRDRLAAILASFAIAFTSWAAMDAGNGLETGLFMGLVSLTAASYFLWSDHRGRWITGALLSLTVLTRPEGVLLIPALLVYRWIDRDETETLRDYVEDAVRIAAPAVGAALLLAFYSFLVNGSFSGTATAKYYFFQENKHPFREKIEIASEHVGIFLGPVLALIALAIPALRRREVLLFGLWWVPVLVIYTIFFPGGLFHYFYRYQHPILPALAVFAGGGAAYFIHSARTRDYVFKAVVIAGLIVAVVPMWQQFERWRLTYKQASLETYVDLEAMAIDLNNYVKPNQTLATHDIGAVGFYGKYYILDIVGLVNKDVIPYHKARTVKAYVDGTRPDWLLIFPEWDFEFFHIFPGSDPHYELVKAYPGGPLRQSPYLLYKINWGD